MFFAAIPRYLLYWSFRNCVIRAFVIHGAAQKMLDHFCCMLVIMSHFCMLGVVFEAWDIRADLYSLSMYIFRLRIEPSCWEHVGGMEGQYCILGPMW